MTALPANVEAEAAFLGAALIENRVIAELPVALKPEHFFEPLHARIYDRILQLHEGGAVVTAVTLRPYFEYDEALKNLGGLTYLASLTADGQGLLAPRELAQQIHDLALHRDLIAAGRALAERASRTDEVLDPALLATEFTQHLSDVATAKSSVSPLPFIWSGDVQPVLDGFWLIDGWLPQQGVVEFVGKPGGGKSFCVADMMAHIAESKPWAGRAVKGGLVIYVVAEGQSGFNNRIAAMHQTGRLSRTAPFALITTAIDLQSVNGDTSKLISTIKAISKACGQAPVAVAVDTLSKTFGSGKENTDDMAAYVANCERVAGELECLVLVVHHPSKNGDGASGRGHSSLRGGVVTAIKIEGDTIRTATVVKQKDGVEGEAVSFRLNPFTVGTDTSGNEVTTCLVEILDESEVPELPVKSPAQSLKGNKAVAYRAIEELIALHGLPVPDAIPAESIDRTKIASIVASGQVADKLFAEFEAVVSTGADRPDKKADTIRRTVRRVLQDLKTAQILGTWGDYIWLAK